MVAQDGPANHEDKKYDLLKIKIDQTAEIKQIEDEVNALQGRLNELKKRKDELSDELKQLAWIRINLGTVTLEPKNTFECCMCDERATTEITINDVGHGLCDFHFKKVIGK